MSGSTRDVLKYRGSALPSEIVEPRDGDVEENERLIEWKKGAVPEAIQTNTRSRRNKKDQTTSESTTPASEETTSKKKWTWIKKTVGPRVERPRPRFISFALFYFWFLQFLRIFPFLFRVNYRFSNPKLSRADALRQRYRYLLDRIQVLRVHLWLTIAVFNSKGGAGKSPTITYMAALFEALAGGGNVLVDMNQNRGNASRWLGVRTSDTLSLRDGIQLGEQLSDIDDFIVRTEVHRQTGLRVITSADMDAKADAFEKKDVVDFYVRLKRVFQSVFLDTGNGMSHSCNLAALEVSDTQVFVAKWDDDADIAGIQETLDGYFDREFGPKLRAQAYFVVLGTGYNWKIERTFELFCQRVFDAYSDANKGEDKSTLDPREYQARVDYLMSIYGITIDRFFMVPFSTFIKNKKTVNVSRRKMGLGTQVGYMEPIVAALESKLASEPVIEDNATVFQNALADLRQKIEVQTPNKEES